MNTKKVGNAAEGQVLAYLLKNNESVLIPFGDNERYDLGIDTNGTLTRIQVKSGSLNKDKTAVIFNSGNPEQIGRSTKRTYFGAADVFGVYCREINKLYMIPVKDATGTKTTLRFTSPKNNQLKKIRLAKDYEVGQ